jgi:hypothetical protein
MGKSDIRDKKTIILHAKGKMDILKKRDKADRLKYALSFSSIRCCALIAFCLLHHSIHGLGGVQLGAIGGFHSNGLDNCTIHGGCAGAFFLAATKASYYCNDGEYCQYFLHNYFCLLC